MSGLRQALDDYLTLRRSAGFKLDQAGQTLSGFLKYLEQRGEMRITASLALQWATSPAGALPCTWAIRLGHVRRFATYLQHFDPRTEVPASDLVVYRRQRRAPYIYSDEDVNGLLRAAMALPGSLLRPTYATLFGLLAVTGMRVGEATNLDRADVDVEQGLLTIRKAKFGKSREIPLHASTVGALRAYARTRNRLLRCPPTATFFASRNGSRLKHQNVDATFLRLVRVAGLWERKPHRPRIHDLRHTFAVRTLTDWYREGLDVVPRLPTLSTYLGHVGPSSTYWYLTATPALLALANERAERSVEICS